MPCAKRELCSRKNRAMTEISLVVYGSSRNPPPRERGAARGPVFGAALSVILEPANRLIVDVVLRETFTRALAEGGPPAAAAVLRDSSASCGHDDGRIAIEQDACDLAALLQNKEAIVHLGSVSVVVPSVRCDSDQARGLTHTLLWAQEPMAAWLSGVEVLAREAEALAAGHELAVKDSRQVSDTTVWQVDAVEGKVELNMFCPPDVERSDVTFVQLLSCVNPPHFREGRRVANGAWRGLCHANDLLWRRPSQIQFVFINHERALDLADLYETAAGARKTDAVAWAVRLVHALNKEGVCKGWSLSRNGRLQAPQRGAWFFLIAWDKMLLPLALQSAKVVLERENLTVRPSATVQLWPHERALQNKHRGTAVC